MRQCYEIFILEKECYITKLNEKKSNNNVAYGPPDSNEGPIITQAGFHPKFDATTSTRTKLLSGAILSLGDGLVFPHGANEKEGSELSRIMTNATVMTHESYRDGYVGDGNEEETARAVMAHARFAKEILEQYGAAGYGGIGGGGIGKRKTSFGAQMEFQNMLFHRGEGALREYAQQQYDSTKDYWKLTANGELVDDGDGWLRDEKGNYILDEDGERIGARGKETGLLRILGETPRADGKYSVKQMERVQHIMRKAGLIDTQASIAGMPMRLLIGMTGDVKTARALKDGALQETQWGREPTGLQLNMEDIMKQYGGTVDRNPFGRYYASEVFDAVARGGEYTNDNLSPPAQKRLGELNRAMKDMILFNRGDKRNNPISSSYPEHKGTDVAIPVGTKAHALFGGKFQLFREEWRTVKTKEGKEKRVQNDGGNQVMYEMGAFFENTFIGSGISTRFLHLQEKFKSPVNGVIDKNSVFISGNTGKKTSGPHLHVDFLRPSNQPLSSFGESILHNYFGGTDPMLKNVNFNYFGGNPQNDFYDGKDLVKEYLRIQR